MSHTDSSSDDHTEETVKWNHTNTSRLINAVHECTAGSSAAMTEPFNKMEVDWDRVSSITKFSRELCQAKFSTLIKGVRQYRTFSEVIGDMTVKFADHSETLKLNKEYLNAMSPPACRSTSRATNTAKIFKHTTSKTKKGPANPNHPKKPKISGYMMFVSENADSAIKGTSKFIKLGLMWQALTPAQKEIYMNKCKKDKERYVKEVDKYYKEHPEDLEVKQIYEELHHGKKRKSEGDDSMDHTVIKRRKKKKEKPVTGEQIYISAKQEEYKLEHPDLDDETVHQKLVRRYEKLSDKKRLKYIAQAQEKNSPN